ncbi:MAG: diguanylate cyclase [Campylobacteraceae bacterium]|nr:diguanylate cyclase [Campylobacteraceae bacterium]
MVRLDVNKIKGKSTLPKKQGSSAKKESVREVASKAKIVEKSGNNEFEKFSQFVLKSVINDNIPPTPNNFQIYFEKLLENKPLTFRKKINEYLEIDDVNGNEYRAKMEKEIRVGFTEVKSIVKIVATVYKNLNVMKQIIKKRTSELSTSSNQLSVENVLAELNTDLDKLSNLTQKQMTALKYHYDKTAEILKDVENDAIFDARYGVYNKKYLLQAMQKELESVKQYKFKSSILMVKIKDSVLNKIISSKEREMLSRNVAKLLLKTSRRSDTVAHFGSGIFTMLMKHTDLNSAQKASERIADLIYATSFFIGEEEFDIDIELGIMPIDPNYSIEETLSGVLEVLPKTGKKLDPYLIGEFSSDLEG